MVSAPENQVVSVSALTLLTDLGLGLKIVDESPSRPRTILAMDTPPVSVLDLCVLFMLLTTSACISLDLKLHGKKEPLGENRALCVRVLLASRHMHLVDFFCIGYSDADIVVHSICYIVFIKFLSNIIYIQDLMNVLLWKVCMCYQVEESFTLNGKTIVVTENERLDIADIMLLHV